MAILPRAGAAQRAGRRDAHLLRPGQHLLVGPIPSPLAVRIRPHRPAHGPLASHPSLLAGGMQLGPRLPAWPVPEAPTETSSGASATGGLGSVDVHREAMMAAARLMVARKLPSVLS